MAIARSQGFRLFALSFDYGQRHSIELESAAKIAKSLGAEQHLILEINMRAIGGSALTGQFEVPKERSTDDMAFGIPSTYVPARNTIFLSFALAWAEVLEAPDIFIGVNALDYSGYPDCRPEYIESFEKMANLATKAGVEDRLHTKIHAPLISMTKADIIRLGLNLGVDYSLTHSCYDPHSNSVPCGKCDSCLLRLKGFADAGATDPLSYHPE